MTSGSDETLPGPPYEVLPHTADLAIRVHGRDLGELFVNAARALFAMMTEPPKSTETERRIELEEVDAEALLIAWLNLLILLHETEDEAYTRFTIEALSPTRLIAHAAGEKGSATIRVIKAATYHDLHIRQTPTGVETTIVFDI